MQNECEILSDLKLELGKFVNKLTSKDEVKTLFLCNKVKGNVVTEYHSLF